MILSTQEMELNCFKSSPVKFLLKRVAQEVAG